MLAKKLNPPALSGKSVIMECSPFMCVYTFQKRVDNVKSRRLRNPRLLLSKRLSFLGKITNKTRTKDKFEQTRLTFIIRIGTANDFDSQKPIPLSGEKLSTNIPKDKRILSSNFFNIKYFILFSKHFRKL